MLLSLIVTPCSSILKLGASNLKSGHDVKVLLHVCPKNHAGSCLSKLQVNLIVDQVRLQDSKLMMLVNRQEQVQSPVALALYQRL